MAKPRPRKRELKFDNIDDVVADARALHEQGYVSHGKWTLGQCCFHLAEWTRYPMDGFPRPPLIIRGVFSIMRMTGYAKKIADKILAEGFTGGMATAPQTVADKDKMSDAEGLRALEKVAAQMKQHNGPLHASPLFGEMDEATYQKVSMLHAEHHLGYLEPKA
ncbi:MAG: DUF1569 domain-containing protein [Planctomycetota bacterium]